MKEFFLILMLMTFIVGCDNNGGNDFVPSNSQFISDPNNVAEPGFDTETQLPIPIVVNAVDDSIQPNTDSTMGNNYVSHQTCTGCHSSNGTDTNTETGSGEDVAPGTGWRATMMANSMRDPYFRARLVSEINRFPSKSALIQDECLRCHAPMLSEQNRLDNGSTAMLDFATASTSGLGRDSVSCTLCHQIDDTNLEDAFNGVLPLNTNFDIYGPYSIPTIPPGGMNGFNAVGPAIGSTSHIEESRLCAGCHVLRTEAFDSNGTATGLIFTEQATFSEYLNSSFPAQGTTCQDCHMPVITGSTKLELLDFPRSPFYRHTFVGGNSLMLKLFRDNTVALGTVATVAEFDQKILETDANLAAAADLDVNIVSSLGNRLQLTVNVENLTGHKLPSGYPSRRMWLHVVVRKAGVGSILFESGRFDSRGLIFGVDLGSIYAGFEPHHEIITQQEEVQIYEGVLGDLDENVTFSLHSADSYLKDNRIPPLGFSTTHP
ncbi:MAG: hypothetical protein AABZ60_23075, partial [Planctomycetota bacterium]